MKSHGDLGRWLACTLCAMGWFCTTGCTRPSGQHNAHESEGPPLKIASEFAASAMLYDANCGSCHDSSRDGAPRLGFEPAWNRRIAQGHDTLVKNAIDGFELMPPKGDNPALTDDEVTAIVEYMMYRVELGIPAKH